LDRRRQPSLGGTSRMNREIHVRICERLGVKFPGPTRRHERSWSLLRLCLQGIAFWMGLQLYGGELPKTLLTGLNVRNVSERRRETHSLELEALPWQRLSWLREFENWLPVFN
ncbi:MAG TPA: hypothetical protein VMG82_22070, partial [Candidatus Sulfotelmatobacter sp.]|nr:hypothetical protein [Candidatus Sulfotelmatobacter sp.]